MSVLPAGAASAAQRGVTLIELIVFIVIMGISVTALLSMYRAVLPRGATPSEITLATQLAQERMELILGQRIVDGYSTATFTDPCVGAASPVICTNQFTPPGLYSIIVTGINPPAVPWPAFSNTNSYRMFGVKVLGPDGNQLANLSAVIANY
jgi:type II secretory pathway pseudopilin PulG